MDNKQYFESLTQELDALKNRVRQFIKKKNWQADGEWKESVIRAVLRRHLPATTGVGRGFVITPQSASTQIDVLLYDKSKPILFQDGDFVLITPDVVRGVIEVKTRIRDNSELEKALKKLANNVQFIRKVTSVKEGQTERNRFFGFFAYEEDNINIQTALKILKRSVNGIAIRTINCVNLGSSHFIRFWCFPPQGPKQKINKWYAYHLTKMSPAYFVHNVIERLCPFSVLQNDRVWYPETGKEDRKIGEIARDNS